MQIVRITIINYLAILNFEYAVALIEIQKLKSKNTLLYEQVLKETSLKTIEKKAKDMGFIKATYFYVSN